MNVYFDRVGFQLASLLKMIQGLVFKYNKVIPGKAIQTSCLHSKNI